MGIETIIIVFGVIVAVGVAVAVGRGRKGVQKDNASVKPKR
ncbi:MAG TPA: hypothetical protein VHN79_03715 [Lacunisphaera sp.]|nr:hypothetical protein [Lacunisphaera sp.]